MSPMMVDVATVKAATMNRKARKARERAVEASIKRIQQELLAQFPQIDELELLKEIGKTVKQYDSILSSSSRRPKLNSLEQMPVSSCNNVRCGKRSSRWAFEPPTSG